MPEEIWKLMDKEALIKFSQSKVIEIGSHGHWHFNLGDFKINEAKLELEKSKQLLEKAIGKSIDMIAYPDGSYTEGVKDVAQKLGYKY